jgi:hypothetical protein
LTRLKINARLKNIEQEITKKANFPNLFSLVVRQSSDLSYFVGLNLLRNIEINEIIDEVKNIHEIFDPLKILKLEIGNIK